MEKEIQFVGYLFLYKRIVGAEQFKEVYNDLLTCSNSMDKVYIFNYSGCDQSVLYDYLSRFKHIEYANLESHGQVADYKQAMNHAVSINAKYATILEAGYFYEDNSYNEIKKRIVLGELDENIAVITPMPLFTCESKGVDNNEKRTIKGSHLTGTIINVDIYKQTDGFFEPYYQTTFDYDYCLMVRKMGYHVVLMNNLILRNRNFKPITKRVMGHKVDSYATDTYNVYYETRNRYHLWNKYQSFDPDYVKLDKKQQAKEFKEMRLVEKSYRDRKEVIRQAKIDYELGKMGKAFNDIKY